MRYLPDSRGFSTVGIMIALLVLTALGYTSMYTVAVAENGKKMSWSKSQATYTADAGVEYAMKQFYSGNSTVSVASPGKSLGGGTFTLNQSGNTVTVTGIHGNATRQVSFSVPTQSRCTVFDVSGAYLDDDNEIQGIEFEKECLASTVIDKVVVSWTNPGSEKLQTIEIENTEVYDNNSGASSGSLIELANFVVDQASEDTIKKIEFNSSANLDGKTFTLVFYMGDGTQSDPLTFVAGNDKVTICHIPPGNPGNAKTKEVGAGALNGHLGHGDTMGPCPDDESDDDSSNGHGHGR